MPPSLKSAFGLPFSEAEAFFKGKLNIPTERWDDLWHEQHARGFMIAGAMQADILADFRNAVDRAISQGVTLETFREDFDAIVKRHGWSYNGGRNWRSRVIYETNIRTAYMAGRWKQMTDPDVVVTRPYLEYRHGDSIHPRPMHLAWNGTILRYDDPWWSTHYPPNGWGCKCTVLSAGSRDLVRAGKAGPDKAPTPPGDAEGIDPGFAYNVGIADQGMSPGKKGDKWEPLPYNQPLTSPIVSAVTYPKPIEALAGRAKNIPGTIATVEHTIGGPSNIYEFDHGGYAWGIDVNAKSIGEHIAKDLGRTPYIPLIPDLITDPDEVWLAWERNMRTGKVRLVTRMLKGVSIDDRASHLLLVAQAAKGEMETVTFFQTTKKNYIEKNRFGHLIYQRLSPKKSE